MVDQPPYPLHVPALLRGLPLSDATRLELLLQHLRSFRPGLSPPDDLLAGVVDDLDDLVRHRREMRSIDALPRHEQLRLVESALPPSYASLHLATALLDRAREALPRDPEESGHRAELALVVCRRAETAAVAGPKALALAYRANGRRLKGEMVAAWSDFRAARGCLRGRGAEHEVLAEIDNLEASFLRDAGDRAAATTVGQWSAVRAAFFTGSSAAIKALLGLGVTQSLRGNYEEAVATTRTALTRVDIKREPTLYLIALTNLALYLALAGHGDTAATYVRRAEEVLAMNPDPLVRLRLRWIDGQVKAIEGNTEAAIEIYSDVARALADRGDRRDLLRVALDLSILYRRHGRHAELSSFVGWLLSRITVADVAHPKLQVVFRLLRQARSGPPRLRTLVALRDAVERVPAAAYNPS